jgi:hypothetical protein
MFIAALIVCAGLQASTCTVVYNTEQMFGTIEACSEDIEKAVMYYQQNNYYVPEAGCLTLPGSPA